MDKLKHEPDYEQRLRECIRQIKLLQEGPQRVGVAKVMRALLRSANCGKWKPGSLDNPEVTKPDEFVERG